MKKNEIKSILKNITTKTNSLQTKKRGNKMQQKTRQQQKRMSTKKTTKQKKNKRRIKIKYLNLSIFSNIKKNYKCKTL